jgi:hypothetical protein
LLFYACFVGKIGKNKEAVFAKKLDGRGDEQSDSRSKTPAQLGCSIGASVAKQQRIWQFSA